MYMCIYVCIRMYTYDVYDMYDMYHIEEVLLTRREPVYDM